MSEDSERLVAAAPHGVVGAGSSPQVHQQDIVTSYNANRSFRLGSIQVVIGILCFIVGCVCIGGTSSSNLHGIGILSGGFVLICAGSVGIAARSKRRYLVIGYLMTSVIGLIACSVMECMSIIFAIKDSSWTCSYDMGFKICSRADTTRIVLDVIFILAMTMALVACIWAIIVAAHICCAGHDTSPSYIRSSLVSCPQALVAASIGCNVLPSYAELTSGQTVMYNQSQEQAPEQTPMMYDQSPAHIQPPAYHTGMPYHTEADHTNPSFMPDPPTYSEKY